MMRARYLLAILFAIMCSNSGNAQDFEFLFYGQQHSKLEKSTGITTHGITGGIYFYAAGDFGSWGEREIHPGEFAMGWAIDNYVGMGSFNSAFAIDIASNIFGITGRYRIDNENLVGIYYDPVDLYGTPVAGYFGSKMVLKYIYQRVQLNAERGGYGTFTGWLSPTTGKDSFYAFSVHYRLSQTYIVGFRYSGVSDQSTKGSSVALQFGFGE